MHAKSQSNAQAMFNLGYMHEHGQGLPFDLHLAKRYYDQALEIDNAAKLPVTLALASLWIRKNHANSFLVNISSISFTRIQYMHTWHTDTLLFILYFSTFSPFELIHLLDDLLFP